MMLGFDRHLHVVAHQARALGLRNHGARVGVGQRELRVGLALELLADAIELTHLLAQLLDLLAQPFGLGLDHVGILRAIGCLQGLEVALDALLDLLLALIDLARSEVAIAAVDGLELAAVDGHQGLGEQLELPAQLNEAGTGVADARAVVMPEVGDGLEVWRQPASKPHELDVALGFALQAPAGRDAVEVAVDVQLEQHAGVIGRTAGDSRRGTCEVQRREIQGIDEGVHGTHWVVFGNVVIQALGQQRDLLTVLDTDDVLVRLPDGALATVCLDWAKGPHSRPWEYPSMQVHPSVAALQEVIDADAADYGDD